MLTALRPLTLCRIRMRGRGRIASDVPPSSQLQQIYPETRDAVLWFRFRAPIGTSVALCKSDSPMVHFNAMILASSALRSKSHHAEYKCRLRSLQLQHQLGVIFIYS